MIRHGVCNFPVPDLGCWFSPSLGKHCTNAQCDPNSSGKILCTSQERQHLVPHFWIKLRSIVNIKVSTPTSHFNTSLNKGQKNHNGEWYEPASMSSNAILLEFLNTGFDHGLPLPGERMRQGAPLRSDSVLKTVTQQLYPVCPAPAPNYPK